MILKKFIFSDLKFLSKYFTPRDNGKNSDRVKDLVSRSSNNENLREVLEEISNSGEAVITYELGIYDVHLFRDNNRYLYVLRPKDLYREKYLEFQGLIRDIINRFIVRLPHDKILREQDLREIVKIISNELGGGIDYDLVFYMIKQELGYGKIQALIEDPYVEDISISGVGHVWIRHSYVQEIDPNADLVKTNIVINSLEEVLLLQNKIAGKVGRSISYVNPILDIQLPIEEGGHRVHMVAPVIAGDRVEIVIRKNTLKKVSIEDLIKREMLTRDIAEYIRRLVSMRRSIIIAGPPGSGKTTLLRAILNSYVPKDWKVIIIEDTPEIEIPPDSSWVRYSTYENGFLRINQYILTKAALRSSVNRLVVIGETRGAEARVLAQALNIGIGALTTFHGGSVREVLIRLMSPPISLRKHQIASINSIIILGIINNKRIVKSISELISSSKDKIKIINIYRHDKYSEESVLEKSYHVNKQTIDKEYQQISIKNL